MQIRGLVSIIVLVVAGAHCLPSVKQSDLFELSVIHFNDFHARFEETNDAAGACKSDVCIGGFSRLYHQVMSLKNDKPDSIVLDAGDDFQGTIWYTVGKWNVTQEFMNTLPLDASVLGNHEFDDGVKGVVPYIKSLNHPVVVSNIDASLEPEMQGTFSKSVIIERNGKKIGIIGVLTSDTPSISSTGKLKFAKESPTVNAEAERLVKEEGVFTNIVLSHCGYDKEQQIAANASDKISLIVGGHSHSFLYTGDNPPGPDHVAGPYPTIVESKHGHQILVTQASAYSKYVGNITIYLDEDGEIADYSGAPLFLSADVPQEDLVNEMMVPWEQIIDDQANVVIGSTLVTLSKDGCYYKECTLGNFVTDAMVYYYTKGATDNSWTSAAVSIMNPGGLRNDIEKGNITYGDMVTAQPFGNTVDRGDIQGKYLRELFEWNTQSYYYGKSYSSLRLLQVSGFKVEYNISRAAGEQLQSIKIRCQDCTIPTFEDLDDDKMYTIAVISFLVQGGDGYTMLTDNLQNIVTGPLDMDVFVDYLAHRSPVFQEEEDRIIVHGSENIVVRNME